MQSTSDDTLNELKKSVLEGDDDLAADLVQKALENNSKPESLIDAMIKGIQEAGKLWKENVYFLPEVMMSTNAFSRAMNDLQPYISAAEVGKAGSVVIGTIAGDMHNLGKMIVINMLQCANFAVTDLGEDIPAATFVEKVKELKPDILGVGCYMTTTMLEMSNVVKGLEDSGLLSSVKVIVGGIPTSQEFADEIGAHAWGKDAIDAVEKCKQLMR